MMKTNTDESIAAEALKYETRIAFFKGSPSAYAAALRRGIFEQVCAHMPKYAQNAPLGRKGRVSSDNAWPLRNSDGLTFAEAKRLREQEQSK